MLVGHNCVSFFDLLRDPIFEWLSNYSSQHVHDPLFGYLGQVHFVREVVDDPGILKSKFKNAFQAEVLVLGHKNSLDIITCDI